MSRDGDVLRAAANAMPEDTTSVRAWLTARAHEADRVGFSRGGYIPGPGLTMTAVQVSDCACGLPRYRFDDGPPEHIITAAVWTDLAALLPRCPILRQALASTTGAHR